jgi:hypothetical protein
VRLQLGLSLLLQRQAHFGLQLLWAQVARQLEPRRWTCCLRTDALRSTGSVRVVHLPCTSSWKPFLHGLQMREADAARWCSERRGGEVALWLRRHRKVPLLPFLAVQHSFTCRCLQIETKFEKEHIFSGSSPACRLSVLWSALSYLFSACSLR